MDSQGEKLVLIDGNAIIHRAYHAIPKTFRTRSGEPTNAVYGFTTTLIKVLEDLHPEYVAATFDLAGPTFRHEVFEEYKATRVKADQELYDQIPRVKQLLETMGIPIYEKEGFEADDCIGTIVERLSNKSEIRMSKSEIDPKSQISKNNVIPSEVEESYKSVSVGSNVEVYIVTGDKDLFQLVDGFVKVYSLKKGLSQTQIVDSAVIKEEWSLDPEDFIDLKALAGDPSDNIPGVPGIGPKTATDLIQRYDTLIKLYENITDQLDSKGIISKSEFLISKSQRDPYGLGQIPNSKFENSEIEKFIENWRLKIAPKGSASGGKIAGEINAIAESMQIKPRILQLLITFYPQALLSQHLATIHRDVPIEFDLEKCRFGEYDKTKLKQLFEELSFTSLLRRFGVVPATKDRNSTKEQKQKDEQLKLL